MEKLLTFFVFLLASLLASRIILSVVLPSDKIDLNNIGDFVKIIFDFVLVGYLSVLVFGMWIMHSISRRSHDKIRDLAIKSINRRNSMQARTN